MTSRRHVRRGRTVRARRIRVQAIDVDEIDVHQLARIALALARHQSDPGSDTPPPPATETTSQEPGE